MTSLSVGTARTQSSTKGETPLRRMGTPNESPRDATNRSYG